ERIARSYRRIHWINPPPATPKPANIVCMTWWAQLTVANVHDATPRTDRCGKTKPGVRDALAGLTVQETTA
ncbi:hypothetical protein, partial [Cryobacterium zongtaii]|uniref:hypothetical protein n=1 Tax=Cryobacterium zongtaii TaxID=1259217 RepID=UPI001A9FF096